MAAGTQERTAQVRIHLRTKTEDIQLPDTGPILVSTEFRRYQLSTLVNRLLETEKPIPLEFLINGQFLRTSLEDFLTQNGISAETTLSVEYVRALVPPLYVASYEHDDWVSSVDVLSASSKPARWAGDSFTGVVPERILSGSYDGVIRVWNMSSEIVATSQGHTAGVKAVKFVSPNQIISSGIDRTIRLWKYEETDSRTQSLTPTLELYGHKFSVDNLAVHTPTSRILSASSDHTIGLWSLSKSDNPPAPETLLPTTSTKRRKTSSTKPIPQRGPLTLLQSHTSQVSDITFDARDPSIAYSSAWDHTLKTWDLATSTCVDTRTTAQSLFSICHLSEAGVIATGTAARNIVLVDPRVSATTVSAMTLRGHAGPVVSLAPDPEERFRFVSAGLDGVCRVWDIRSVRQEAGAERVSESVYVIDRESGSGKPRALPGEASKVFGVCWDREVGIVSCGEDKRVQINRGAV